MPAGPVHPSRKESEELQFGKVRVTHAEMGCDGKIMGLPLGIQIYHVHG